MTTRYVITGIPEFDITGIPKLDSFADDRSFGTCQPRADLEIRLVLIT